MSRLCLARSTSTCHVGFLHNRNIFGRFVVAWNGSKLVPDEAWAYCEGEGALVKYKHGTPTYHRRMISYLLVTPLFYVSSISCHLVRGEPGHVVVGYKVLEEHTNLFGTLHGGMSATLVDIITSMALIDDTEESLYKMGVSVDLSLRYMKAAQLDDELLIEARLRKLGKTLAFLDCEIKLKDTSKLVVTATHTKFVGQ